MMYKVGDRVLIKSWDKMVEEFGINQFGDIQCQCSFVKSMREYCGKVMTIRNKTTNSYLMFEDIHVWMFSDDMIECHVGVSNYEYRSSVECRHADCVVNPYDFSTPNEEYCPYCNKRMIFDNLILENQIEI